MRPGAVLARGDGGERGDAPLWSQGGAPTSQARALVTELNAAQSYGLRAQDYAAQVLSQSLAALSGGLTRASLARQTSATATSM